MKRCPTCHAPILGRARRDLAAGENIGTMTVIGLAFGLEAPGAIRFDPEKVEPADPDDPSPCGTCIRNRSADG